MHWLTLFHHFQRRGTLVYLKGVQIFHNYLGSKFACFNPQSKLLGISSLKEKVDFAFFTDGGCRMRCPTLPTPLPVLQLPQTWSWGWARNDSRGQNEQRVWQYPNHNRQDLSFWLVPGICGICLPHDSIRVGGASCAQGFWFLAGSWKCILLSALRIQGFLRSMLCGVLYSPHPGSGTLIDSHLPYLPCQDGLSLVPYLQKNKLPATPRG